MAIPAAVTTATVHHDAPVSFGGEPGRVMARFTPSVTLIWEETGTPLAGFFDAVSPENGEPLEIELPHTDQPGFLDGSGNTLANWHYSVKMWFTKDGQSIGLTSRDFQVPSGQSSVDLALIPWGLASEPTVAPMANVTSVNGQTGDIQIVSLEFSPTIIIQQSQNNNDTAAAQTALDECRDAGGGEVVVPYTGKTWRFNKLTISRNTLLRCQPGVVIKRLGNTFGITNIVPGVNPLLNNADPYSGHGNIQIIGGVWDGNLTEAYGTGFNIFYFSGARDILIEGVTIRDGVTNHCIDLNGVSDAIVRDSRFLGFKDASVAQDRGYAEAIQCSQNIDDSSPAYYPMLGTPSKNILVDHCTFGASGTAGTVAYPAGFGTHGSTNDVLTHNIVIRNCTFDGQSHAGVVGYTYNNLKVTGNTFTGCAFGVRANNFTNGKTWNSGTSTWTTGGPTRKETSGMQIANNHFIDTVTTDISVLGTNEDANGNWATANDITIIGNFCKATTATKRTGQNIRLLLCKTAVIQSNQAGYAADSILVDSCVDVGIHDNKVTTTGAYGIKAARTAGVPVSGTVTYSSNIRIGGNSTEKTGSHGIGANLLYGFSIVGNRVQEWGFINAAGNGILASGSDQGLISSNDVFSTTAGLAAGISVVGGSTNVAVTPDNRVTKPDGTKVGATGTGVTYGTLQYV